MASAQTIADRALEMASAFLEVSREDIERMVGDDVKLLFEAAQIVRQRTDAGGHTAHSVEHLAFSLITAAHEQLRTRIHPTEADGI